MIRAFLAVAANRVIVDSGDNLISIIDVIESIKSQSFPIIIPSITFLFSLRRDIDDILSDNKTIQCLVDDIEILRMPVNLDFQQSSTTRSIINFQGFAIPSAGVLEIRLLDEETVLGEMKIPVVTLDVPQPHMEQNTPPTS